jgi:T4-like virus tail tube protein gp19
MATRKLRTRPEPRPVGNADFLVDLGLADPQSPEGGFAEVLLPPLRTDEDAAAPPRLVLRRGVTGALDLYTWWDRSRRPRRPQPRDATVTLLGPGGVPVMTWRFTNARPVALSYSPLRASEGTVMMETIEIAFDAMQVTG